MSREAPWGGAEGAPGGKRIVVLGGTGALGRVVVRRLVDAGQRVRITSRRPQPPGEVLPYEWRTAELRSGNGLDDAVRDADVVVHAANVVRDADAVRSVLDAARRAGSPHLVYISIVGIERVPFFYYRQKLAAEGLIERSGQPHTILRATQFHDLIRAGIAAAARLPVVPLPDLPFQPIDTGTVADRLAELAVAEPAGRVADVGGPEVRRLGELARSYLGVVGSRRPVWRMSLPGKVVRAVRDGALLAPGGAVGAVTFADYLTAHADPGTLSYRGAR